MNQWFRLRLLVALGLCSLLWTGGMFVGCGIPDSVLQGHRGTFEFSVPASTRFGVSRQNIINGSLDSSLPAVGALVIDDFSFCTATLIAKKVLATAAHCIEAAESYGIERVKYRIDLAQPDGLLVSKTFDIDKMFMHPKYSASRTTDFSDYDIGVVILKKIVTDTPTIEPYLKAIPSSWKGQNVKVMGYGVTQTYPNEIETEEKRSIEIPLHTLEPRYLVHFDEKTAPKSRKSACHGDSGGPVLFKVSGVWQLIAVNSAAYKATPSPNGGTYCDGGTSSTRLDASYKDFLASILTSYGDKALPCQGNQCGDCETCQNNACMPKTIAEESYRCKACRTDSDCGNGLCLPFDKVFRCVQPCSGKGCCPNSHDCQHKRGLSGKSATICLPKVPCPKVSCQDEKECSSSEQCVKGSCVLKPPGTHPMVCRRCATSADCGKDNYCVNATSGLGYCVQRCWQGNVCPDGFKCKEVMPGMKQCMPQQICRPICSGSNPCPAGYQCKGGQCYHPTGGQLGDFCDSKNQCDGRFQVTALSAHSGTVYALAFDKEAGLLATASSDKTVKVWDTTTNTVKYTLSGHQGAVFAVAFSPDGKSLATGSADRTIKIWDVSNGQLLQTLQGHTASVRSLMYSSTYLASGSSDTTIKLWSRSTNLQLASTLKGHTGAVYSVLFRGSYVVSGSGDNTIKIWSSSGKVLRTIKGHKGAVRSLALNNNESLLVSGSEDKTVRVWRMTSGSPYRRVLSGPTAAVHSVLFSANNENVIAGSIDHSIRSWRGYDSALLRVIRDHASGVHSMALASDKNMLAVGLADGSVVLRGCFDCGYQCVVTDNVNYYKRCIVACIPPPQPDGKLGGRCINDKVCEPGLLCYPSSVVGKSICVEACSTKNKQCKLGGKCELKKYGLRYAQCRCASHDDCPKGHICSTAQLGKLQGTGLCLPEPKCPGKTICKSLFQKPYGQFCVPSSPEQPAGAVCSLVGKCEPKRSSCLVVRRGQSLSICGESCAKTKGQCKFGGRCENGDAVCYCTQDSDCASNRKCRPVTTTSKGVSRGICAVPEGSPCVSNGDCVVGYSCFHGKCHFGNTPPPEPGPEPGPEPEPEPAQESTTADASAETESKPEPGPEAAPEQGPEARKESNPKPDATSNVDKPSSVEAPESKPGGGCGCSATPSGPSIGGLWILLVALVGFRRRRQYPARPHLA